MTFDLVQLRVIGALIEKEITTPENYPLSLNSLLAACNQRSSRDPVLDLGEDEVRQAVHSLEDMAIVAPVRDARVPKYEHRIRTVLNLRRDETAVLCLLLLRGPQTPGELRSRADRMYSFDDLAAVQSTLERLATRGVNQTADADSSGGKDAAMLPLVVMLARQPGARESRFAHLLGGPVSVGEAPRAFDGYTAPRTGRSAAPSGEGSDRAESELAARVKSLEAAVELLQSRLKLIENTHLEASMPLESSSGER